MTKAEQPTSKYQVACDHFDTFGTAEIHSTDDGWKLKLTIENEDKTKSQSISLFKEDVQMMIAYLEAASKNLTHRQ